MHEAFARPPKFGRGKAAETDDLPAVAARDDASQYEVL